MSDLCNEIRKILGLHKKYNVIIVGAGMWDKPCPTTPGCQEGFNITAMFDANPA